MNCLPCTRSRIDSAHAVARYTEEVLARAGSEFVNAGGALLEEYLRSPCTEEIAVFRAFARAVDGGQDGVVVLDTAPTRSGKPCRQMPASDFTSAKGAIHC